jgi:hypothetical protein
MRAVVSAFVAVVVLWLADDLLNDGRYGTALECGFAAFTGR